MIIIFSFFFYKIINKKTLVILFLFLCVFVIHAENENSVFVINSVVYEIDGITRPFALNYRLEIQPGEEIKGEQNLKRYLQDKTQLLLNERVLESASIEHTIGSPKEDGKIPVDIVIVVKDTWNIIAIPYPQYSSNTGFSLTLKARDYNFLGTMSPLRIDIGYQRDTEGRTFFTFMLDSDTPFTLFGLNWNLDFDHDFHYRPDMDEEFYYKNTTGLSVELPFRRTTFTVGFSESFIYNQENPRRYRAEYGRFQKGLYLSSNPFISWRIPTGFEYYDLGEVHYTPRLSATFNHELPGFPLAEFRKGPFINFSHGLNFGRINWEGNSRRGAIVSANNTIRYNFYNLRHDVQPWSTNINITGRGHTIVNNYIGISSRLMYRHWFLDDYHDDAGDVLRGILDNKINANYMLSLNIDIPIKLIRVRPSEWSDDNKFLRIFDFDMHVVPIIDAAFYNDPVRQRVFGLENLLLTAGMELIIFPQRWRSLFLRVSYGRNFSIGPKTNSSEIFIGTELHY